MTEEVEDGDKPLRDVKGRLLKGQSGNPSGRPKTERLTSADKRELKRIIDSKDMSSALAFMCERATTVNDAFRYVKEFAPYLAPKLQTINSISKNDNTITIEWKSEMIKKVEDIDGEYEKLVGPSTAEAEIVEETEDDNLFV